MIIIVNKTYNNVIGSIDAVLLMAYFIVFSLLNIYLCRRVTRIQIGEKWIILIEVVCTGVLKIFYSTPTILSFKKPEVFKYCNYGYKIKPSLMWLFKFRLVLKLTSFVFL